MRRARMAQFFNLAISVFGARATENGHRACVNVLSQSSANQLICHLNMEMEMEKRKEKGQQLLLQVANALN